MQFTKERLEEIAEDGFLKHGESKELARIALASLEAEPVAFRSKLKPPAAIGSEHWDYTDHRQPDAFELENCVIERLFTAPPAPVSVPDDYFSSLVAAARVRADKAMRKFPQPNYVLNKVAEESGEVIKAVIHFTEGREEWQNVEGEIIDNLAMLIRLVMEGDQVIGFTPPDACRGAMLQGADDNSPVVPDGWVACSERMPEDRESVLLWDVDLDDACSGHYSHETGNFYQAGMIIDNEITHWMPLPAAPQQEAK